ncbi:MAG TPA: PQQ-binding-like beta-propeller repeat protein [Verrucomicrobiae bacterium]
MARATANDVAMCYWAWTWKTPRGHRWPELLCFWLCLLLPVPGFAATGLFRFAWLSDTHVGSSNAVEDLRVSVQDINSTPGLSFVIVSGDITEYGSREQLGLAKRVLDELSIPYHIIPGNHDTKWSESGGCDFRLLWQNDRFAFEFGGCRFIGMHQGPLMKMGDGHWAPQDVRWLEATLKQMPDTNEPVVFVTHYPVNDTIDNWYLVLDLLRRSNTQVVLCGHGHANRNLAFETIPGVMGRSNLGTSRRPAGFNLVQVQGGTMTFTERLPGAAPLEPWLSVALRDHRTDKCTNQLARPDFSVNDRYAGVRERWIHETGYTIASSPARWKHSVIAADTSGTVRALALGSGTPRWTFTTSSPIVSTPAAAQGRVIFAGTDGVVYALNAETGVHVWHFDTARPIVASPIIHSSRVYIGSSQGLFRALDLRSGKLLWQSDVATGFVESRPLLYEGKVIFAAWDQHLYALNEGTGELAWTWHGGQPGVLYSPAACWPVAAKDKVFIVAPDRKMTALSASTGDQLWRTGDYVVRESIGLSANGSRLYVRAMNDFFYAFPTAASQQPAPLWKCNAHFGYDINPASLVEKGGVVFYGTKNGLVFALDGKTGTILWRHKFGVGLINTLLPISASQVLLTDSDGRIALLEHHGKR